MMDKVANRLDLRPAVELLGGWPEIQPVCISINVVPAVKGLKPPIPETSKFNVFKLCKAWLASPQFSMGKVFI